MRVVVGGVVLVRRNLGGVRQALPSPKRVQGMLRMRGEHHHEYVALAPEGFLYPPFNLVPRVHKPQVAACIVRKKAGVLVIHPGRLLPDSSRCGIAR